MSQLPRFVICPHCRFSRHTDEMLLLEGMRVCLTCYEEAHAHPEERAAKLIEATAVGLSAIYEALSR